jgi:pimeloyl-ACP methyl ester carboxylesterase
MTSITPIGSVHDPAHEPRATIPGTGRVSAEAWFASGTRRGYDPVAKRMSDAGSAQHSEQQLSVFERVVASPAVAPGTRWLTMLPGFPDGSYGFAQVDRLLEAHAAPRLYIEYLGQGDSDKPTGYRYSTPERADLVQAQWNAHGIRRTMVVTFDYSSLVLFELLRRQQEHAASATEPDTVIDAVFIINGGLFADAHSHPWQTTPMLKTTLGRLSTKIAQRSPRVFDATMRSAAMFSRSYHVSQEEIADLRDAITRRNGAAFLHAGASFVDEHRAHPQRWDLQALVDELGDTIAFHLAGSEQDPFEPRQITAARQRLNSRVDIRTFPGGHLTTSEHPDLLATAITQLAHQHNVGQTS